jgi:hypothetical protein
MAGVPATVTSTGTLIPVVPGALMAMAALKVPPPCSVAGFTVTCSVLGRPPEEGDTVSQFPPLLATGVAVNEVMLELVLASATFWVTDTVLFAAKLKLSEAGFVVIGLMPPAELALNCTGTVRNPPVVLMLMNPTSVPEVGAPDPIDTDNVIGVTPLVGVTTNQLLVEKADTVMFAGPLEDVIWSACVGADAPLKRSWGGFGVSEF